MRLRQIVQAANFNRFHRAGLSATQFMTLNALPGEGMTLSELARKLNLSPASLNQTVNSLEERGLLRRLRSTDDARKIRLSATAEGAEMLNAASVEFRRSISSLFAGMSKREREGLLAGLEQMVEIGEKRGEGSEADAATPRAGGAPQGRRSARRSRPG